MTTQLLDPTTDSPTSEPSGPELLATMRGFAAEIDARATEGDAARRVPQDLVDRMQAAGVFRMSLPRSLGGLELDPPSVCAVIEDASRADGSTGWTIMIGQSPMFFAWLDPRVAASMIGTGGDVMASSMFGPMGRAVPDGNGGLVVNGRWPFNSACVHAGWHALGVMVTDGDAPGLRADGQPDRRFAYVRRSDVEIVDTWDAGGLRATSSHDIVIRDLVVPDEHTAMPMFDAAPHDGPLWKLPFFVVLGPFMASVPLGIGRRALDELAAVASTKARGASPGASIANDTHLQVRYAQAEAGLRAARGLLFETATDAWDTVSRGDRLTPDQEALVGAATQQCMRAGIEAVDLCYTSVGGSAAYSSHPLQRCFRDIHTATQHLVFRTENWTTLAKVRFGVA